MPYQVKQCAACGHAAPTALIELPDLPLTALFQRPLGRLGTRSHDQCFLFCERCGHGMLETQLPPQELYGAEYGFRTAASDFGRVGSDAFLSFLEQASSGRTLRSIVDVGCNDLYLLRKLSPVGERLLGIDPIWSGREQEVDDPKIKVVGKYFEEVDIKEVLGSPPDAVICRHTLEHIDNPRLFLEKLLAAASPETLFVFEFPHLDTLIERYRFDHIFHQHVQYFSKHSFARLLNELGAEIVLMDEHLHHWEALLVAFRKRSGGKTAVLHDGPRPPETADIGRRYELFRRAMSRVAEVLNDAVRERLVGFGAAQMLPVIFYHLGNKVVNLETVYDDDKNKDGLSYVNLPLRIKNPTPDQDLSNTAVFITAPDSVRPIIKRLQELGAKEIIIPSLIL